MPLEEAKKLACGHMFHKDCLMYVTALTLANSSNRTLSVITVPNVDSL